jgi:serine/threonine-protein kinase
MSRTLEQVGHYKLVRLLGSGGMGEVFLALPRDATSVKQPLALKRLLPQFTRHPGAVELFLDEAKLGAQLTHPHIIKVVEFGHDVRSNYFIVMEYVCGMSARDIIERHATLRTRVPARIGVEIVAKVADALAYAHALRDQAGAPLRLVHRDVTPRNILLSTVGEVKLIDFGIAKSEQQEHMSVAGALKGKREYMSPEQSLGRPIDGRSDLFSLAIVLCELLGGQHPFWQSGPDGTLKAIRAGQPTLPSQVDARLAVLDAFLLRAMSKKPEQRFEDARSFAEALRAEAHKLPPSSVKLERLVCGMADERVDEISRTLKALSELDDGSVSDMSLLLAQELERSHTERTQQTRSGGRPSRSKATTATSAPTTTKSKPSAKPEPNSDSGTNSSRRTRLWNVLSRLRKHDGSK